MPPLPLWAWTHSPTTELSVPSEMKISGFLDELGSKTRHSAVDLLSNTISNSVLVVYLRVFSKKSVFYVYFCVRFKICTLVTDLQKMKNTENTIFVGLLGVKELVQKQHFCTMFNFYCVFATLRNLRSIPRC